jgi:hypothetical protein
MATSNFHNVNASHIFACSLENEWDFDDLKDNLFYEFKSVDGFSDYTKSDPNELRSYPSHSICSIERDFNYNDFSLNVIVTPVIRSAYYDGCNLDWHVWYGIDGNEVDIDDIEYHLSFIDNLTPSQTKAEKKAEVLLNEIVTDVEKVFEQYSEKLGVTARFSNGETMYHKVA